MSDIIIPSSEQDRKTIRDAMQEISNAFTRIEAEREFIKEALKALSEKVDVPKKILTKMSKIYHKRNLDEVTGEMDDIETLYQSVIGSSN